MPVGREPGSLGRVYSTLSGTCDEARRARRTLLSGVEEAAVPIYEYRCRRCREVFDLAEHVAEHGKSHPRCPKCNSEEVEPVFTTFYAKTSKKS